MCLVALWLFIALFARYFAKLSFLISRPNRSRLWQGGRHRDGSVCFDSMLRAGGAGQARQDVSIRRVLLVSAAFLVGGALLTVVGLKMGAPWRTRHGQRQAAGYLAVP